jgi:hypothetical protein
MKFEIDVSGQDIFLENYTICISCKEQKIIRGFKFNKDLIDKLISNWKKGNYKYNTSKKGQGFFKVRVYCIILYHLFKSINEKPSKVSLTICRDFSGHKNDINQNLKYFLEKKLVIEMGTPLHQKLPKDSGAHWYAYLMAKDNQNLLPYVNIGLEEIEEFLITPKGQRPNS